MRGYLSCALVSGYLSNRSTSSSNVEAVWPMVEVVRSVGDAVWSLGEAIIFLSEFWESARLFE